MFFERPPAIYNSILLEVDIESEGSVKHCPKCEIVLERFAMHFPVGSTCVRASGLCLVKRFQQSDIVSNDFLIDASFQIGPFPGKCPHEVNKSSFDKEALATYCSSSCRPTRLPL